MKLEEIARTGIVAIVNRAEHDGRDVHAVLLLMDVVTSELSLQTLPSENGPSLCCMLHAALRQFVTRNPALAGRIAAEVQAMLAGESPSVLH